MRASPYFTWICSFWNHFFPWFTSFPQLDVQLQLVVLLRIQNRVSNALTHTCSSLSTWARSFECLKTRGPLSPAPAAPPVPSCLSRNRFLFFGDRYSRCLPRFSFQPVPAKMKRSFPVLLPQTPKSWAANKQSNISCPLFPDILLSHIGIKCGTTARGGGGSFGYCTLNNYL